jgi:hypothetical protein
MTIVVRVEDRETSRVACLLCRSAEAISFAGVLHEAPGCGAFVAVRLIVSVARRAAASASVPLACVVHRRPHCRQDLDAARVMDLRGLPMRKQRHAARHYDDDLKPVLQVCKPMPHRGYRLVIASDSLRARADAVPSNKATL